MFPKRWGCCTGDLVRWLPSGCIEFLGRIDSQVRSTTAPAAHTCKRERAVALHYFVENPLCILLLMRLDALHVCADQAARVPHRAGRDRVRHGGRAGRGLGSCLVLTSTAGNQQLVGYVTPETVDPAVVLESLRARLPAHFVPVLVIPLRHMPLLPNEKVDRKALASAKEYQPDWSALADGDEYVEPRSELEARLQAVWQEVLGRERISTHKDFFAAGGNSLQVRRELATTVLLLCTAAFMAVTFCAPLFCAPSCVAHGAAGKQGGDHLRRELGCELLTAQLFKTPTIAGLAAALGQTGTEADQEASVVPRASFSAQQRAAGVPCSANQEQMLVLHQMQPDSSAYHMADTMRLRGNLGIATLEAALAFLAGRHESLRTHFIEHGDQVLQAVYPVEDPRSVPVLQRRSLPAGGGDDELMAVLEDLAEEPYQLIGAGRTPAHCADHHGRGRPRALHG